MDFPINQYDVVRSTQIACFERRQNVVIYLPYTTAVAEQFRAECLSTNSILRGDPSSSYKVNPRIHLLDRIGQETMHAHANVGMTPEMVESSIRY
ncbi:hypothetical protein [Bremerella alba]|uniref:hypothetical protein n=1 Tax=Bremerella alba TaxID=980252 RepID=UPI001A955DC5|nr:hypothetical protein [Bremerella alba]